MHSLCNLPIRRSSVLLRAGIALASEMLLSKIGLVNSPASWPLQRMSFSHRDYQLRLLERASNSCSPLGCLLQQFHAVTHDYALDFPYYWFRYYTNQALLGSSSAWYTIHICANGRPAPLSVKRLTWLRNDSCFDLVFTNIPCSLLS